MIFGDGNGEYLQVTIPFQIVQTSLTLRYYNFQIHRWKWQISTGYHTIPNSSNLLNIKVL